MKKGGTPSSVTVAVRVRPLNEREKQSPDQAFALELGDKFVALPNDATYVYDAVFGPEHSTQDLYEAVAEPIVSSSLAGINGTIFAYGQTASGKTFSMQGTEDHPGILRLAAKQLFAVANDAQWTYSFVVSYVEIYNERVKDLMSTATGKYAQDAASDLKIREDRQNGFYVDGVVERAVSDYESLIELFEEGEKRRHVAGTDMNLKSSRSHTIFTINVIAKQKPNETGDFAFGTLKSRLSLVDLAGSESARLTNAEGERLKEGAQINKSLLALSLVISSLAKTNGKDAHVKFRDSKLTQILQPSLAGNCRTAVVCCVTPAVTFLSETSSTLKFASSAKHIQTQYVVNQIADVSRSIKSYQDQLEALSKSLREEQQARSVAERAAEAHGAEQLLKLEARITQLEEERQRIIEEREAASESVAQKTEELLLVQAELEMRQKESSQKLAEEKQGALEDAKRQIEKERETWKEFVDEIKSESESKLATAAKALAELKDLLEKEREEHLVRVGKLNTEWEARVKEMEQQLQSTAAESEEWRLRMTGDKRAMEIQLQDSLARCAQLEQVIQVKTVTEDEQSRRIVALMSALEEKDRQQNDVNKTHEALRSDMQARYQKELGAKQTEITELASKHELKLATMDREFESRLDEEVTKREQLQCELAQLGEKSDNSVKTLIMAKQELEARLDAVERQALQQKKDHVKRVEQLDEQLAALSEAKALVERDLAELQTAADALKAKLAEEGDRFSQQDRSLQDQLKREQMRTAALDSQLAKAHQAHRDAIEQAEAFKEELASRIETESSRSAELETSLKESKHRLAIASEQIANLKLERDRMEKEFQAEREELRMQTEDSEESRVSRQRTQLQQKNREIAQLNERLTGMKKIFEEEVGSLKVQKEEELKQYKEQIGELEAKVKRMEESRSSYVLPSSAAIVPVASGQEEQYRARIAELESEVERLNSVKMTREIMEKAKKMKRDNEELKKQVVELQSYRAKYEGMKDAQTKIKNRGLQELDENSRPFAQ